LSLTLDLGDAPVPAVVPVFLRDAFAVEDGP
jgi:hypothetical protein